MIKSFRDIIGWQKAHQLTLIIYSMTKNFPDNEKFSLVSQMRRASISIGANLVEGFKRNSIKDKRNFITISISSLEELKYHLLLAKDLSYINKTIYHHNLAKANELSKILHVWLKSHQ